MNTSNLSNPSRRHFISASLGASALILAPRRLFAEETGIVPTMIEAASQAKGPDSLCTEPLEGPDAAERLVH